MVVPGRPDMIANTAIWRAAGAQAAVSSITIALTYGLDPRIDRT
jgi:hypothetical protein